MLFDRVIYIFLFTYLNKTNPSCQVLARIGHVSVKISPGRTKSIESIDFLCN
jgi:hypothetical protein